MRNTLLKSNKGIKLYRHVSDENPTSDFKARKDRKGNFVAFSVLDSDKLTIKWFRDKSKAAEHFKIKTSLWYRIKTLNGRLEW